jgi:NADH-quinone oxidoreductase subunit G
MDLDMGPVIKKNMNRCIHCTRCIRFGTEIAGIHEMVAVKRGNNTEITTIDGRSLETDYAGNYADICPTGSLTLKDFRFKKRAWYLKKTASVCDGCTRGCNIDIHHENNKIYRLTPRQNDAINKYWMCDEGRFGFHHIFDENRITEPTSRNTSTDWKSGIQQAKEILKGKNIAFLVGTDLTLEEGKMLLEFVPHAFPKAEMLHFGSDGVQSAQDDGPADAILKRKNRTGNLHGLEKLGIKGLKKMPSVDGIVVLTSGRCKLPKLDRTNTVGIGVFTKDQSDSIGVVLPSTGFGEKEGTIVNFSGVEQKFNRAVAPRGMSKQLSEILMMWNNV